MSVLLLLGCVIMALNSSSKHTCAVLRSLTSEAWRSPHPAEIKASSPAVWDPGWARVPAHSWCWQSPGPVLGAETFTWLLSADLHPHQEHPRSEVHGRSSASKTAVEVQPCPWVWISPPSSSMPSLFSFFGLTSSTFHSIINTNDSVLSDSLLPHGCSLLGSSVHGTLQARIME